MATSAGAGVEGPRRRRLVVAIAFLALTAAARSARAGENESSPLAGGGSVSESSPSAVPATADTPAPAEEPGPPPEPTAGPRSIKLWPFFVYESDPAARKSRVRILGPLLEYRADAERQSFFFRPFISISQSRLGHDDDVHILYALLSSHWGQTEQVTKGLGGLFTYRTRTSEDGRTLESQRARILPVYVYEWEHPEPSGHLSVAPFYADVTDLFGYERVEMVMFPAYLHVQRPSVDRHYYLFPLISRDGDPGSGYRLWPFPLRDRQGRPLARDLGDDEH